MKREIKFRAYCSTDDGLEMVYFGNMQCDNGLWFNSEKHIDDYESKIMQFTGKADKNKKEIYEGDIIDSASGRFLIEYKDTAFVRTCIYILTDDGRKIKNTLNKTITLYETKGIETSEIIGNIHENPELLKLNH